MCVSVCNKGQTGNGGRKRVCEFKKRIISLKTRCFNTHKCFIYKGPKGLSAPLQDFSQTSPRKKKNTGLIKRKVRE